MTTTTRITLHGYLVGGIWWPVGQECWKDLSYDATDQQARTTGKMTLRDHVLRATNDGDFQSCVIACGELWIERETHTGQTTMKRARRFDLNAFPSIRDCLHDDPDWCPQYPEDDDLAA